jgi:hypothetical protein
LFYNDQEVIGVLVVLLVVVIIAGALGWRWHVNQPQITQLVCDKTLTFEDKEAHSATQVGELTLQANHKGARMFSIGSFSADGSVQDIRIDNQPPTRQQVRAGAIEAVKEFRNPLERGAKRNLRVSVRYIKSFPKHTESWTHVVAHKTKILRLAIEFHPERPCTSARAYLRYGGQVYQELSGVEVYDGGRRIRFEVKRPKLGSEYTIEWDW